MKFQLKINKDYAQKYDKWRQKEELNKLKDKYGKEIESSSSDESDDEVAEGLTKEVEEDWVKTLAALKSKNPKIYKEKTSFYRDIDEASVKKEPPKKSKDRTAQSLARRAISKKSEKLNLDADDSDTTDDGDTSSDDQQDYDVILKEKHDELSSQVPGYYEEQEQIKQSFKEAAEIESDEDTLLTKRSQTIEQRKADEDDYHEWLKTQPSGVSNLGTSKHNDLVLLKTYWNKSDLGDDEKFLRDYILNKKYLDADKEGVSQLDDPEEDEDHVEEQELFEKKYNFRFEEPDKEFIKKYPRSIDDSLRKVDNKRSEKRKAALERKSAAKKVRLEEIKRLKNLKKLEIDEKLNKLKEVTGNQRLAFDPSELETDFDPELYDHMMQETFDGYDQEGDDVKKPIFEYDAEIDDEDNWDQWPVGKSADVTDQGLHADDPYFNMDADYDPTTQLESKRSKRNFKKTKFLQSLLKKKPAYNPDNTTFDSYYKEYYDLDYEDVIDDMPCRFKYKDVTANNFGLDIGEILSCPDRELNKWNSFKAMNQMKSEEEEVYVKQKFKKRGKNEVMKRQLLPSLFIKKKEKPSLKSNKMKVANINRKAWKISPLCDNEQKFQVIRVPEGKQNVNKMQNNFKEVVAKTKQHKNETVTNTNGNEICADSRIKKLSEKEQTSTQSKGINCQRGETSLVVNGKKRKTVTSSKNRLHDKEITTKVDQQSTEQNGIHNPEGSQKLSRSQRKRLAAKGKGIKQRGAKKKITEISDERLRAYGVTNVKQFRYTHRLL